ncbi:unnamed protein product [Dovyalis caffra]|uniref:MI domain-containing protein n=1 Tax=Dovyalis caffra TaxID=77055 RepID=A0AAV1S3X6_9ROSI|nr:unnamed protein product [Dovyalis caffra]
MHLEKKNDELLYLLKVCFNEGLIITNEMTKGFTRIRDGMDDPALDIPNDEKKFDFYVMYARKKGRQLASFGSSIANGSLNVMATTREEKHISF